MPKKMSPEEAARAGFERKQKLIQKKAAEAAKARKPAKTAKKEGKK